MIHIRRSTPEFTKFPSLVLIRLVLTEIRPFKNVIINKEMYGTCCILLTIGSIYTKLGDFVKLGLHFMTIWINQSIWIIYRLVHPVPHNMKSGDVESDRKVQFERHALLIFLANANCNSVVAHK